MINAKAEDLKYDIIGYASNAAAPMGTLAEAILQINNDVTIAITIERFFFIGLTSS